MSIEINLDTIINFLLIIFLGLFSYLLFEGIIIATRVRRMMCRIDTVTNVTKCFSWLTKFKKSIKKS